jgi:hypothetical protein
MCIIRWDMRGIVSHAERFIWVRVPYDGKWVTARDTIRSERTMVSVATLASIRSGQYHGQQLDDHPKASNEQIYGQWQYAPESLGSLGGRLISVGVVATSPATRESLQGYLRARSDRGPAEPSDASGSRCVLGVQ